MSLQIQDILIYNEKPYGINNFSHEFPFSLQEFNLKPKIASTACYKGYKVSYKIVEDTLYLESLSIREAEDSNTAAKAIYGVLPIAETAGVFSYKYNDINTLIPYTGSIYADYQYYKPENDSFYPNYKHVIFEFENGNLINYKEKA